MKNDLIKLCIDAKKNTVEKYSREKTSDAIRQAFIELMGTDTPDFRKIRRHKPEIFEIIEITLEQATVDGWETNPFFQQFVEVKNLAAGDTNSFYVEDKSMLVISEVARGTWNLRRQKLNVGQNFTVPVKTYGAKVYTDFRRFIAGRIDWPEFVAKIQDALNHVIASQIYAAFMSSGDYLPAAFTATGSYAEANLLEIVSHVKAANGQAPITIAGTLSALSNVSDNVSTNWLSEEMKEQMNKQGMIQYWRSYPLFEIPQVHAPNSFDFMVDDDALMVLPNNAKPVKLVWEGQSEIQERGAADNMDQSLEHTFLTNFGVAVTFNLLYGMYDMATS